VSNEFLELMEEEEKGASTVIKEKLFKDKAEA
jgi:hypothetical protein